jgi:hypothetical protein
MNKTVKVLRVVSQRENFRRAGFSFGRTPIDLPLDSLSAEKRKAIEADPGLVAIEVDAPVTEEAVDGAAQSDKAGGKQVKK